ncbi:MAG: hypothetical protein NUV61_01670 [Candidatus Azambacteria bacterium]|nr:hypothetical protein [Candidatus Azambacteria bacterium]
MGDQKTVVLEDFEGDGEAVTVSLKALIGDHKSPGKKEEECCGKHQECKRTPDAHKNPTGKGGKK